MHRNIGRINMHLDATIIKTRRHLDIPDIRKNPDFSVT